MNATVSAAIQILLGLALYILFAAALGQHLRLLRSAYPPAPPTGRRDPARPAGPVSPPATLPTRMAMLLA